MIFANCNLIQQGEAALFYKFNRSIKGYMITGVLIAPDLKAKLDFSKVWIYFVSEVVRNDDIYCSIVVGIAENSMFTNYIDYHSEIDGLKIYKVDNFLKNKYSSYVKQKERTALGNNL
tara:strand:- start:127 stop:480 length:354 start_codon:yes stop_codon:yes gene_type:complete